MDKVVQARSVECLAHLIQRAQVAGAHFNLAAVAVFIHNSHLLDVGLPEAPRPSFGVADIMPERGLLTS